MKQKFTLVETNRVLYLKGVGWDMKRLMKHFNLSRAVIKKICAYEIVGEPKNKRGGKEWETIMCMTTGVKK